VDRLEGSFGFLLSICLYLSFVLYRLLFAHLLDEFRKSDYMYVQ
jgi:hypothetical protein